MTLLIDIVIPALILVQLSAPDRLGPTRALFLALSVSIGRIVWTLWKERRVRPTTVLGLASVLMLGVVAVLALPGAWIAVKEALLPGGVALVLLGAQLTGHDLAARLLLATIDMDRVRRRTREVMGEAEYSRLVRRAGAMIVGAFLVSACVNFLVAWLIVTAQPGTAEFNEQIAATSVVSAIAALATAGALVVAAEWYLLQGLHRLTGIPIMDLLRTSERDGGSPR